MYIVHIQIETQIGPKCRVHIIEDYSDCYLFSYI